MYFLMLYQTLQFMYRNHQQVLIFKACVHLMVLGFVSLMKQNALFFFLFFLCIDIYPGFKLFQQLINSHTFIVCQKIPMKIFQKKNCCKKMQ